MIPQRKAATLEDIIPPKGQYLIEGVGSQADQDRLDNYSRELELVEQERMLADIGYVAFVPNMVH